MKKVIVSIHGFNSGPGDKSLELQKQFPGCEVIAPQLPYDPLQAIELLKSIVDQHSQDEIHIVGTSLGAFYTMYLSRVYSLRDNLTYYLINTSFEPHITLRRYEGKSITNFKTQEQFKTTPELFEAFETLYAYITKMYNADCIHASNYFIGTEDEVIDFTNFINFIKSFELPYRLHYSKQGHRYADLSSVIQKIKENMVF